MSGEKVLTPENKLKFAMWDVVGNQLSSNESLGKGKAIPLQARTGPEGTRRSRLPDFKTIGT